MARGLLSLWVEGNMAAWYCRRCGERMKRNPWGWFVHLLKSHCECQHADWCDED